MRRLHAHCRRSIKFTRLGGLAPARPIISWVAEPNDTCEHVKCARNAYGDMSAHPAVSLVPTPQITVSTCIVDILQQTGGDVRLYAKSQ